MLELIKVTMAMLNTVIGDDCIPPIHIEPCDPVTDPDPDPCTVLPPEGCPPVEGECNPDNH